MSKINNEKKQYSAFWEHQQNKLKLDTLLEEVKELRKKINKYEGRNNVKN